MAGRDRLVARLRAADTGRLTQRYSTFECGVYSNIMTLQAAVASAKKVPDHDDDSLSFPFSAYGSFSLDMPLFSAFNEVPVD